jgi:hypothetical protein
VPTVASGTGDKDGGRFDLTNRVGLGHVCNGRGCDGEVWLLHILQVKPFTSVETVRGYTRDLQPLKTPHNLAALTPEKSRSSDIPISLNRSQELK